VAKGREVFLFRIELVGIGKEGPESDTFLTDGAGIGGRQSGEKEVSGCRRERYYGRTSSVAPPFDSLYVHLSTTAWQ